MARVSVGEKMLLRWGGMRINVTCNANKEDTHTVSRVIEGLRRLIKCCNSFCL